jgi:hypothetical protein
MRQVGTRRWPSPVFSTMAAPMRSPSATRRLAFATANRTSARGCLWSPTVGDHGQCWLSRRRARDARGRGNGPHDGPRCCQIRNPEGRRYRACLRHAQGPRGCAFRRDRACSVFESTRKREVCCLMDQTTRTYTGAADLVDKILRGTKQAIFQSSSRPNRSRRQSQDRQAIGH